MKPKKWTECYPQGTKEGDEECKFFLSLSRSKQPWRSVATIALETGLPHERVEKIISKYLKMGLIFQSPKNDDYWGYWERHLDMLPSKQKSVSQKDQDSRIDKGMNKYC